MTKKILYIILGTLILLGLTVAIWFWFFNKAPATNSPSNLFGSSENKNGTGGSGSGGGNNQAPIGSNAGTGVNGAGGTGSGTNSQTSINNGPITPADIPFVNLADDSLTVSPDALWNSSLNGSGGVVFNPSDITAVNTGTVSGGPYIPNAIGADGKPISLLSSLGVVIAGCIVSYGESLLSVKVGSFFQNFISTDRLKVPVAAQSTNETVSTNGIRECLVRTLGKMAVQQITNSTVNWINSGFNGKPAYVQDFNKFFSGVADQAAGAYLQSSDFAFLCSPFKLQVRIAVAQSYARRNNAPSCTLTQAVGNVNKFLNGNFAEGGWQGLISFTTESGNNPFASFMKLSGGLTDATGKAQANATLDVNLGSGFLSVKKCTPKPTPKGAPTDITPAGQDCTIVTPGAAIDAALKSSFGQDIASLQVGDSIQQILSALTNALVTKALYGGLFNVNKNSNTATSAENPAQVAGNKLMTEMNVAVTSAQNYGSNEQKIITDIQSAQQNLAGLQSCWTGKGSAADADAAKAKIDELQTQITLHDKNIQKANDTIAAIQELQTNLLVASLPADVTAVQNYWSAIKASDAPHIYDDSDVTSSQQDRVSVQSTLSTVNADTSAKLEQCYGTTQ